MGLDKSLENAVNEAREIVAEGASVVVKGRFVTAYKKPLAGYTIRYTFGEDGFDAEAEFAVSEYFRSLPRFGLGMRLNKRFNRVKYCAYGPGESYSDKCLGTYKDVFLSKVSDEYSHLYIRPQESGSHWGADFAEVTDGKTVVYAEGMQSFSAVGYSAEELTHTRHDDELPASDATYFTADFSMCGIGSRSCGPELPFRYCVPARGRGQIGFRFRNAEKE